MMQPYRNQIASEYHESVDNQDFFFPGVPECTKFISENSQLSFSLRKGRTHHEVTSSNFFIFHHSD